MICILVRMRGCHPLIWLKQKHKKLIEHTVIWITRQDFYQKILCPNHLNRTKAHPSTTEMAHYLECQVSSALFKKTWQWNKPYSTSRIKKVLRSQIIIRTKRTTENSWLISLSRKTWRIHWNLIIYLAPIC